MRTRGITLDDTLRFFNGFRASVGFHGWAGSGGRHLRRFDPSTECLMTRSGTVSPCRSVKTVFRINPRSSSTTKWLRSRATRQPRNPFDAPPVTARAAVTTSSGGSAIAASCAQVAQRWDCWSRSAVHT